MPPSLIRPPALRIEDVIGVFSPSWPAAGMFPQRLARARFNLDNSGYVLKLATNALRLTGHTAGTPQQRADDLHQLFLDPEVAVVMSAIGGNVSNELLPLLDWELIRAHPKIVIGYSDTTVLLNAIHARTGLVTFHGPALIPQWGEYPDILPFTLRWFRRVLGESSAPGAVEQPTHYTDEMLDWATQLDQTRATQPAPAWQWLQVGRASGPLIGGHLSTLHLLAGTPFWPEFDGAIFFWEAVWREEGLADVNRYLNAFANLGVFDQIAGMVIALPDALDAGQRQSTTDFLTGYFGRWRFPVLFGPCFGHLDPMLTLPIGVQATLDSAANCFSLDEPAVSTHAAGADTAEAAVLPGAEAAMFDRETLQQRLGEAPAAMLLSWAQARLEAGEDAARVVGAVRRIDRIVGERQDLSESERLRSVLQLVASER